MWKTIYCDLEKNVDTGQKDLNNFYKKQIIIPTFSEFALTY